MPAEIPGPNTNLLVEIAKAHGNVELDRGGFWSRDNHIWVDKKFPEFLRSPLLAPEVQFIETLGATGLTIGHLFDRQLQDAKNGVMWPNEVLGENGAEKLLAAAEKNPSILYPYSLMLHGLDEPSVPYSVAYTAELIQLGDQIIRSISLNSPSVKAQKNYLLSLLDSYTYDPRRKNDLAHMDAADRDWIKIPADVPILVLIEPTETYYDPALAKLGQNKKIIVLANDETDKNGLGPWRPFFEFKMMMKEESATVTKDEIDAIRQTSRKLFKTDKDKIVPVSLEFRRLLLASGQGSHPVKMAKNYPNSEKIRDQEGYKNVLYSNMIEEGTLAEQIPALEKAFGHELVQQFDEQQLVRGAGLRVVGHEENHPFRRFRDAPLEELKSTVNGFKAIFESGRFSVEDINAAILTEIGAALFGRSEMVGARLKGDQDKVTSRSGYYKADTILMNYLAANGGLKMKGEKVIGLDFDACRKSITKLSDYLAEVRQGDQGQTIPQVYYDYNKEDVWDRFNILQSPKD